MREMCITFTPAVSEAVLVPTGITTPHEAVTGLTVSGGRIAALGRDSDLNLTAALIIPEGGEVCLRYGLGPCPSGAGYPEAAFRPRATPYTTPADDLAQASRKIAAEAGGGAAGIAALVAEAEARFAYGHPTARFNDGHACVPYLSCGITAGSCVDINTYLVASLRAAGYEAAYIYGAFFPRERGGITHEGHCWVVTRCDGQLLEWDIAHHMKAGLGPTRPGLNPRPGERVALTHSMGHVYGLPDGALDLKLLGQPMVIAPEVTPYRPTLHLSLAPFRPDGAPA